MRLYFDLFLTFFRLGATTFGGGYAMISQMKEIVVEKKGWTTEDELLEICAIAESTPGPVAINLSTYLGYKRGNILGSILATIGVVLPSFIIIFIISLFLNQFLQNIYVQYAFVGIKCAVAFLILKAGIQMVLKMPKNILTISIFLITTILMILFDILSINFSSIFLIIIGGAVGIIILSIINRHKERKNNDIS